MDVNLAVLADYANVSREGKLNILGVFAEVNPPTLPFTLPMMYVVATYQAGPAEFGMDKTIKLVLLDSDGKQLISVEQPVKVPQAKRPGSRVFINHVGGLAGVKFEKPGDYAFVILISGEEKISIPLHVNEPPKGGS